jgi:hypothetical protein
MAYLHVVNFDINSDQLDALKIGASLERVLGYLRTLLPGEIGYITARAFYSVESDEVTRIVFLSEWEEWEDLQKHEKSSLVEDKIIKEFDPHIKLEHLTSRIYNEVA